MRRAMKHRAFERRHGKRDGKVGESLPLPAQMADSIETVEQLGPSEGAEQNAVSESLWRTVLKLARVAHLAEQGLLHHWEGPNPKPNSYLNGKA